MSLRDFQTFADGKQKADPEFGLRIAQYVDLQVTGVSNYFYIRNQRFRQNRAYANGRVNMNKFQDLLEMNGQTVFTNLNWKSIMTCNTIVSRLVGKWMGRNEKISVRAVDPDSLTVKRTQQVEAEFILHNKDLLANLEKQSGVPMIGKDQFVPEDKDDIEMWKQEWQCLPDEIAQEEHINNVLEANGYANGGEMKEKTLHDSAEVGFVGTKTWMDNQGVIRIKWVEPENAIYSYTQHYDISKRAAYVGECITMTITQIREMFPDKPEEEIFELAQTAKEYQLPDKILWVNQWNTSIIRPYDDWNIDLIDFEFKSYDKETYLITETKKNKSTIVRKISGDVQINENQSLQSKDKVTIYHGLYARQAKKMLVWEVKKNMIRPLDPKNVGDAEFSYSFYMYQNWDMKNLAIPEKIQEPLDQMILARLKMQQLVAKMRPTGAMVNIDALNELDIGLGDATTPLDIQKVYDQTGMMYYRGRDAEGNPIPLPIQELANAGFLGQMQGLIALYDFHYKVLKDELGEDPALMQALARPRVTEGNANAAIQTADDATDYMYDAYLHVMEETAEKIACLTRLSVIGEANVYRSLTKQQVLSKTFTTSIRELPTEGELAQLQLMINAALQSNPDFVEYFNPFTCMRMAKQNIKLGQQYYFSAQKKMIATRQQIAMQNAQQNAQVQAAAAQQKAQGDMQKAQMEGDYDLKKAQINANGLDKNALVQGIMQMYVESQKSGIPIPPEMQPVAQAVIGNILMPVAMQNQAMIQGAQQQAAQQQAMQQQQEQQEDMSQVQQPSAPEQEQQPQQAA